MTTLGTLRGAQQSRVFMVEDAVQKMEASDAYHATAGSSVCGTVQQNPTLPFDDGTGTKPTANNSQVRSVNYSLSDNRGFPTYEATATIEVTALGDR